MPKYTRDTAETTGPPGVFLLGNIPEFRRNPLHAIVRWQAAYGDLVRFRLGPRRCVLLSHPDLAEELLIRRPEDFPKIHNWKPGTGLTMVFGNGLLTSSGALWKRQRQLIQPVFHRSKVAEFGDTMVSAASGFMDRWQAGLPGVLLEVDREMTRLALEIITRTMFNLSVLEEAHRIGPALETVLRYATQAIGSLWNPPLYLPTPSNVRFKRAMAYLDRLMVGIIAQRRKLGRSQGDFLDLLMAARDEVSGEPMSDQLLRDEVLTVFVAGHETTANTLTWTWYLLARHPGALERLHAELDDVLGGRPPTVADLPSLRYTRAVFEETLRLFGPVAALVRRTARDMTLWDWSIPKDTLLLIALYNIHRHPDFWAEPAQFRPERFLPEGEKPKHRLAYMPFSAGPRVCVGNHFALTEGTLLIASIAQRFELRLPANDTVEPELRVTVKPKGGLRMSVHPRRQIPHAATNSPGFGGGTTSLHAPAAD